MLLILTLIQVVLISWLCSGTRPEFLAPMVVVAALMFLCASFSKDKPDTPLFKTLSISLCVVAVMSLIAYFNPFYELVRGERFTSFQSLKYFSFLPTSISAGFNDGNALRALAEIASAIATCLSCMILFKNRKKMVITLAFFAFNVAAMGIYGIWQKLEGIPTLYNTFHTASGFFGSFFLSNAAGAYFNLGLATSIALAFLCDKSTTFGKFGIVASIACAIACICASYYSESNGAILLSIATIIATPIVLIWRAILERFGMRWATTFSAGIIAILLCIGTIFTPHIERTLTPDNKNQGTVAISVIPRLKLYKIAQDVIAEHPVFGCGGWSSQYLMSLKMAKNASKDKMAYSTQHIHCDILEYIAEFGIIGAIAIFASLAMWIADFIRSRPTSARTILMLGCAISIAHSCFDMNLHIPSTMIAMAIICAATVATRRRKATKKGLSR